MEWWLVLVMIIGCLLFLMVTGMPIAFCFLLINLVGVFFLWRGAIGLEEFSFSLFASVASFTLLPVPLFILMGEVVLHSGIASLIIDTLDKWLGRLPGRLGLLAVGAGTLFATLTGSSLASVAMLGSLLVPEMEKRGYKKSMSLGPILGSGGLAMMIPPTSLAVLLAAIGEISVGGVLMAIIVPGLVMAALYAAYIIVRCKLQPSIAPAYEVPPTPLTEKLALTARYVLPIGFIIFLVIGLIIMGIATPTEAAATGALGAFILTASYGRLNWEVMRKSFAGALQVTVMVLMIIVGAKAFGQILAFSGTSRGLIQFATGLPVSPIFIMISMQVVLLIMGTFMEIISIMMITTPLFMPVIIALGFDPVWFAVVFLINMEVGALSPPFGLHLFVLKGVAPPDTTMGDIIRAALPFMGILLIIIVLVMAFPALALWLPAQLH